MVGTLIANMKLKHDVIHVLVYAAVVAVLFFLTSHPVMERPGGKA